MRRIGMILLLGMSMSATAALHRETVTFGIATRNWWAAMQTFFHELFTNQ